MENKATSEQIEQAARLIADAMGDNYSDAFRNKQRWVAKRGMSGGGFRDVNEPFKSDYDEAAGAVLAMARSEYWYRQGKDDGVQMEREASVCWLRRQSQQTLTSQWHCAFVASADAIERGEHLERGE